MKKRSSFFAHKSLSILPITTQETANTMASFLATRLFHDNYRSVTSDLQQGLASTRNPLDSYGKNDHIRASYLLSEKHVGNVLTDPGHHKIFKKPIERAYLYYKTRQMLRTEARSRMDPKKAEDLKKRDLEKYGNENGPSFEYVYSKVSLKHPEFDENQIGEEIIASSLRSSREFNEIFGIDVQPIAISPKVEHFAQEATSNYFDQAETIEKKEMDEIELNKQQLNHP